METYARRLVMKTGAVTGVPIKYLLLMITTSFIVCFLIGWKTFLLIILAGIGLYVYFRKVRKLQDVFTEQEKQICAAIDEMTLFLKDRKQQLLLQVDLMRIERLRKEREKSLLKTHLSRSKRDSEELAIRLGRGEYSQSAADIDRSLSVVNEQLSELSNETCAPVFTLIFDNNPLFACISKYGVFHSNSEIVHSFENPKKYSSDAVTQTKLKTTNKTIASQTDISKNPQSKFQTDLTRVNPAIAFNTTAQPRDYSKLKSPVAFIGEFGSNPGQFASPTDIYLDDANDLLYVADSGYKGNCNRVHILSKQGKYIRCVSLDETEEIRGFTICDEAVFFSHYHRLHKYTLKEFKLIKSCPGLYQNSTKTYGGITTQGKEIVVATNGENNELKSFSVSIFDINLNYKRGIGQIIENTANINGYCQFPDLKVIQGMLYSIIYYSNPHGTYFTEIYIHNSISGKFVDSFVVNRSPNNFYCSLCLDSSKSFIVSSYSDSLVEIYNSEKKLTKTFRTSEFDCCGPNKVRVDNKNNIFVLFKSGVCPLIIL